MPELPEVETVMRGLAPALEGRTIGSCEVRRAGLRVPVPPDFARRLTGRRVLRLRRRAKYILADLDGGETLVIHLGMSGRMTVCDAPHQPGKHDHVVLATSATGAKVETGFARKVAPILTTAIVFTDPRRFGLMTLVPTVAAEADPLFADLGPEPLLPGFTGKVLAAALKGKKTPIKAALLDQCVVAGLGNIYVCEALFLAGISPKRLAAKVTDADGLVRAIKTVLRAAIKAGGSTLRDYRHADGALGYFQHAFKVYDREGAPCPACGGRIRRIVQAGRSTYYCPTCQK